MQTIYGFERCGETNKNLFAKSLEKKVSSVKELYLYNLYVIKELADFLEKDAERRKSKHLPSKEDENFNTKFLSNTIVQHLTHNEVLRKKEKVYSKLIDKTIVKELYDIFLEEKEYQRYILNEDEFNFDKDRQLIKFLFNSIFLANENFHQHLLENWPSWIDDAPTIIQEINKTFKKSKSQLKLSTESDSVQGKIDELKKFSIELFNTTIDNKGAYNELIQPKLRNWEAERLASIDKMLLRMALAEMLNFPSIPIKVTINEYIDIAKEYSTPKSGDFVNGVLDKLMRELKANGKLIKEGRGLIE